MAVGEIIKRLVTVWSIDVEGADSLKKTKVSLEDLKGGFLKLGAAGTAALTAMIVPALNLERAMSDVVARIDDTQRMKLGGFEGTLENMTNKAFEFGQELGIGSVNAAKAFNEIVGAGVAATSEDFDKVTTTAVKFAKVVGVDVGYAAEKLTDVADAMEGNYKNLEFIGSNLFRASQLSTTSTEQLIEAMAKAAPAGRVFGASISEVTTTLAAMASVAKGAEAGSGFRRIILRLAAPTKQVLEDMKGLGETSADAAKAKNELARLGVKIWDAAGKSRPLLQIFRDLKGAMSKLTPEMKTQSLKIIAGQYAFGQLGAIIEKDIDTLDEWQRQLEMSGGLIDKVFTEKSQTAFFQLDKLFEMVKDFARILGMPLLKPFEGILDSMNSFIMSINSYLLAHPKFTKALSGLISYLSLVAVVTGTIGVFLIAGLLAPVLIITLKIFALVAVIGAVILVAEDFYQTLKGGRTFFNWWIDQLTQSVNATNWWKIALLALLTPLMVVGALIGGIVYGLIWLTETIFDVGVEIGRLIEYWAEDDFKRVREEIDMMTEAFKSWDTAIDYVRISLEELVDYFNLDFLTTFGEGLGAEIFRRLNPDMNVKLDMASRRGSTQNTKTTYIDKVEINGVNTNNAPEIKNAVNGIAEQSQIENQ